MHDSEVTLHILNQAEKFLGTLHPKYVNPEESDDMTGLRSIKITHPLFDDQDQNLNKYNNLLTHGNKVWWQESPNGNGCLYVLLDDKSIDSNKNIVTITAEEVATEISQMPSLHLADTSRTINSTMITNWLGGLFRPGTIETCTFIYTGVNDPMTILKLIASQCKKEIQFRYFYDPDDDLIYRYIDIITTRGKVHNTPIEIGYNTDSILVDETEATVAIAASPTGTPSDSQSKNISTFNAIHNAFTNLVVDPNVRIPKTVTKDDNGNDVNGPLVYPPYPKLAGQHYVQCNPSDSAAEYTQINEKEKGTTKYPRTVTFDSSTENPIMLYWECVAQIDSKKQPAVTVSSSVIDIPKMKGQDPEYYNAGDTVRLRLPGRKNLITARITKTTKNPRQPEKDKCEIGNYKLNLFKDYFNIYSNSIKPY